MKKSNKIGTEILNQKNLVQNATKTKNLQTNSQWF